MIMSFDSPVTRIIDSMKDEMNETLQRWIRIPSIKSAPLPDAPFGADIKHMLDIAMDDCRRLGFYTKAFDGYAGHAELGEGDDREALGILAHLDVVPVGDGWTFPPFGAVIEDGRMYGRGTGDDKGPAVAALYAMKAVKEAQIPLRRKVKLILGCDEESGSACMAYYKKAAVMPRSGFSPDANYPVINIEKGMIRIRLSGKPSEEGIRIISFNTGDRPNVIPGKATAHVSGDAATAARVNEIAQKLNIDACAEAADNGVLITVTGINGHAAFPESARNSIGEMLLILKELGAEGGIKELADHIGPEYYGQSLNISVQDGISGKLTCNLGMIRMNEKEISAILDIRYPVMTNPAMIVKNITGSFHHMNVKAIEQKEPHYVPESSQLVQCLLDAYHEVTGNERKCLYTGGGTYARELEEGVAFGAEFPGDKDLAHQANEYIDLGSLCTNAKIFANAIVKLCGKE